MTELKRVKIRRERASFPAFVISFLILSIVFYLSTLGVKKPKAITHSASGARYVSREIALDDINLYLIALTDGENAHSARISSARYMQRGAAGYLYEKDGKTYSIGNAYFSKEEAERMTAHLTENGIKASAIPLFQRGATLRVTAEEETLDALVFCLSALRSFEKSLMDYSTRIDAGELSEREAQVLLSVLAYDLSEKKPEAERAVLITGENAVKDIFTLYLHVTQTASELTKSEGGEMMLSARIKYAAIDNAILRMNILKAMNA